MRQALGTRPDPFFFCLTPACHSPSRDLDATTHGAEAARRQGKRMSGALARGKEGKQKRRRGRDNLYKCRGRAPRLQTWTAFGERMALEEVATHRKTKGPSSGGAQVTRSIDERPSRWAQPLSCSNAHMPPGSRGRGQGPQCTFVCARAGSSRVCPAVGPTWHTSSVRPTARAIWRIRDHGISQNGHMAMHNLRDRVQLVSPAPHSPRPPEPCPPLMSSSFS